LGTAVAKELLKSELFDITVLTRESSTHTYPSGVKVVKVDYSNFDSLVGALEGQDALVSTVAGQAIAGQRILIDAAVKAGVKRVIPSEFGCDLKNHKARALPAFQSKVEIEEYLDDLAVKGVLSYTLIFTGGFLDMGLRNGMFFNFKDKTAKVYDGGDQLISTSRLVSPFPSPTLYMSLELSITKSHQQSTAGKAVRRVLTHPRETSDRAIWVKDIDVSQNALIKLAQALTPGEKWTLTPVSIASLEKESLAQIKNKEGGIQAIYGLITCAIFGTEFGNKFEHVHNSVLGIKGITEPDLEELVASIFGRREV
jgi:hypothetical protein